MFLSNVTTTMTFDWGVILGAVAPMLTIILTWILQRRAMHTAATVQKDDATELKQSVGAVHSLVNGQRTELVNRVAKLEAENLRLKKTGKKKKK